MAKHTDWRNRIVGHGDEAPDQLLANPKNWRVHPKAQQDALAGVLSDVGWVQPVLVNKQTGFVIDGHLRVAMAISHGDAAIPVTYVDLSPEEEAEILATFDPLGALAVADKEQLDRLLREVQSGEAAVQGMLAELAEKSGLHYGNDTPAPDAQIDRAAELQEKWQTSLGQLWQVGAHRILCGDSTKAEDVARVMQGEKAALGITSPPYGVGKSYEMKGIGPWMETVRPAIAVLCQYANVIVWQIVDWYCTGSQYIEPTFAYSLNMFSEHGFRPIWIRIWLKQGQNHGVAPYHLVSNKPVQQYEYIGALAQGEDGEEVDSTDFEWIIGMARHRHKYVRRLSDVERRSWGYAGVWKINTVQANDDHPAMFPLELPERCIKMHTDEGGTVLDSFLGSATTLVACERLGRKGRGIEISPAYTAVGLERLSQMGLTPKLIQ